MWFSLLFLLCFFLQPKEIKMSQPQPERQGQLSAGEQNASKAAKEISDEKASAAGQSGTTDTAEHSGTTACDLNVEIPHKNAESSNAEDEDRCHSPITIGEALEATAITAGNKLVERSDAAAIQAAEVRATGRTNITPGGLAATAQSAAQINAKTENPDEKITLADILTDAASKLPKDKPATRQDAEGVVSAELRNNPDICTHPTGVAASVVAAARLNQQAFSPRDGSPAGSSPRSR